MKRLAGIACAAAWLLGLGAHPLFESTEGRYASIAAGMSRTGNFLEPRFDGLLHFDKPPLAYWAGAAALRLLPDGEFAIRLPATLAWALALVLVAGVARALGLGRRRALWAAAFAGLAPLAVVQGRMLSSDIFLWAGVLLFQLGWARGGRPLECGAGLGLGFLAKGPVVLMWTVLPALVAAAAARDRRPLAGLLDPRTWVVFALLGLPWYLLVALHHPDVIGFWLGRETADRYLTTVHGRTEPWWYFPALLPAVVLPWLPEAIRGVRRAWQRGAPAWGGEAEAPAARTVMFLAFAPFVFLCFSASKRPNYLLPMIGPLALLAAAALPEQRSRVARIWIAVWTILVLAMPFGIDRFPGAVPPTRTLVAEARGADGPLVAFRVLPASLPFYAGEDVPTVDLPRGTRFDPPEVRERWAPEGAGALGAAVQRGGTVLARSRDEPAVREAVGRPVERLALRGGLVLLRVEAADAATR